MFISVADRDKAGISEIARQFIDQGFKITATDGTCRVLRENGIDCDQSYKFHEGQRPNIVDQIVNGEIAMVINTPAGKSSAFDDAYIRKASIKHNVPYVTTPAAAKASILGIAAAKAGQAGVKSLQSYHQDIS